MSEQPNLMRSFLFVPGNRPERFEKARDSGTDIYCIDLQDAVPAAQKGAARRAALEYIANSVGAAAAGSPACYLRINSLATADGLEDLLALAAAAKENSLPDCIVLPMISSAFEIRQITAVLGHHPAMKIMPMVETPQGIDNLPAILEQGRSHIEALAFGFADYVAITGSDMSWDALLSARSSIVKAASAGAVRCFDGPCFAIADLAALQEQAVSVSRIGFTGKLAIHPSQVDIINKAFVPSPDKVKWARSVIEAFEQAGGGVVSLDGMMIDQPVVEQARRIVAVTECLE